jgi:hypothetical protein
MTIGFVLRYTPAAVSLSSWLSIVALIIASVSAFIALLKEKRQRRGKRWHRNVLFGLTLCSLSVGIFLIRQTSKESARSEAQHQLDRKGDKEQIAGLTQAVETQTNNNETQYLRYMAEIHRLQDQLTDLKKLAATEEMRRKMDALRVQLDKALAPTPKAKLEPGFWTTGIQDEVVTQIYSPVEQDVATFGFTINNTSEIDAKAGTAWIRICTLCAYADGTDGSLAHVAGAPDIERMWRVGDLPSGARTQKLTVNVRVPSGRPGRLLEILVKCRCDNCEIEKGWQKLFVTLGGIPFNPSRPKTGGNP